MPGHETTLRARWRRSPLGRATNLLVAHALLSCTGGCGSEDLRGLTRLTLNTEAGRATIYENEPGDGNYTDCTAFGEVTFDGAPIDDDGSGTALNAKLIVPAAFAPEEGDTLMVPDEAEAFIRTGPDDRWEDVTGEILVRRFENSIDMLFEIEVDVTRPTVDDNTWSTLVGTIVCEERLLGGDDPDVPERVGGGGGDGDIDFD